MSFELERSAFQLVGVRAVAPVSPPSQPFLIEGVLRSKNLFRESYGSTQIPRPLQTPLAIFDFTGGAVLQAVKVWTCLPRKVNSKHLLSYRLLLSKPLYKLTITGRRTGGQKKPLIGARACALPKNS